MANASANTSLRFGALSTCLRTCLVLLGLLASSPAVAGTFGMHYWPQGHGCETLDGTNWPRLKPIVEKDLDHLASLGVGAIRLMFWPGSGCGYSINALPGTGGSVSVSTTYQNNLRELIALMGSRGFDIFLATDNSYLKYETNAAGCSGLYHWQCAYGPGGFGAFLADSSNWMAALVQASEQSPYAHKVRFYDFIDEASGSLQNGIVWTYIAYLYDHIGVPVGKRGISLLHIPGDAAALKAQVIDTGSPQRHFDFVTFNTIDGVNVDNGPCPTDIGCTLQVRYDELLAQLGESASSPTRPQVVLGSFGIQTPYNASTNNDVHRSQSAEEQAQKDDILATIRAARNLPQFFSYVHWMFTDLTPSQAQTNQTFGLIYANPVAPPSDTPYTPDMHSPKAALGAVAEEMAAGSVNFDMGDASCTQPLGWWATPSVPLSLSCGHTYWDTATGEAYGRITVQTPATGSVWMATSAGIVEGKSRLFVNFFFRSNLSSVRPDIHEHDVHGNRLRITQGPAYSPGVWGWNNYLHRVGSWSLSLLPNTHHVVFAVAADLNGSFPAYLDVDAVSVSAR
jgi:hypothetical protein